MDSGANGKQARVYGLLARNHHHGEKEVEEETKLANDWLGLNAYFVPGGEGGIYLCSSSSCTL